jgi:hypothetical protein
VYLVFLGQMSVHFYRKEVIFANKVFYFEKYAYHVSLCVWFGTLTQQLRFGQASERQCPCVSFIWFCYADNTVIRLPFIVLRLWTNHYHLVDPTFLKRCTSENYTYSSLCDVTMRFNCHLLFSTEYFSKLFNVIHCCTR